MCSFIELETISRPGSGPTPSLFFFSPEDKTINLLGGHSTQHWQMISVTALYIQICCNMSVMKADL